ncbi:MAG: hypothetical protein ACR2NP_03630, partial [Pirellulaceae bacterium]
FGEESQDEVSSDDEEREMDDRKLRYMEIAREIEAAVHAGDLSGEAAKKKLIELRNEMFGEEREDEGSDHEEGELEDRKLRYMEIAREIEAAVHAGELSKEEAKKKLIEIRQKMFGEELEGEGSGDEDRDDLRRQMFSDVLRQRAVAERMAKQRDSRGALNHMRLVRDELQNSDLNAAGKSQLLAVVEREIAEMERFIEQNPGEIENDEMDR